MENIIKKSNTNSKPGHKWQAIRKHIVSEITSGNYLPGDAIPSENYICDIVGVSRTTVRQAFKELENEGLIYRVKGKGTFLADISNNATDAKKEKNKMFCLVIPEIREPFYSSLTQGFEDFLSKENLQTLVCDSGNDVSKQGNIFLQLLHRAIDGIAIVPSTSGKTPGFQIQLLIDNGIPVVLCHRGVEGVRVPVVTWDREKIGHIVGETLAKKGHRDIAYFATYQYEVPEAHIKGLRYTLNQAGIDLPDSRIIFGPRGDTDDCSAQRDRLLAGLLSSVNRPTAIMCNSETEVERVFWLAYKMGIKIPQDISIIGFGDSHRNTIFKKMLTAVVLDELELGSIAARMIHEISQGLRSINDDTVVSKELHLYEGSTVATI